MKTRADICAAYTVNEHGIIQDPGKFEAEPVYAPALYDLIMDGASDETIEDETGKSYDVFIVDVEDIMRQHFPEDISQDTYAIVCDESDQGFFNTRELSQDEYQRWYNELTNSQEDQDEPDEPQEDDLTTEDHLHFYQNGKIAFTLEETADGSYQIDVYQMKGQGHPKPAFKATTYATVEKAVKAYMDYAEWWPNCWFISDHGNAHLMTIG